MNSPQPVADETSGSAVLARDASGRFHLRRAIDRHLLPAELSRAGGRAGNRSRSFRPRISPRLPATASAGAAGRGRERRAPAGLAQVRAACAFIARHADGPITLAALAAHVGTSPFHFQRTFSAHRRHLAARLPGCAAGPPLPRRAARRHGAVRAPCYDAGYGSISRVYEHSPTGRGMTPARHRRGGLRRGDRLHDGGFGAGPAARCRDVQGDLFGDARRSRRSAAGRAADGNIRAPSSTATNRRSRSGSAASSPISRAARPHLDLPVDVQGTAFQWKVWRYLQSIPYGETRSYSDVARAIGAALVGAGGRACLRHQQGVPRDSMSPRGWQGRQPGRIPVGSGPEEKPAGERGQVMQNAKGKMQREEAMQAIVRILPF